MSDDHVRLIAKIQHFYDVMIRRLEHMEEGVLTAGSTCDPADLSGYRDKSVELNFLTCEYSKTFQNFLYKDDDEK